ncbi:hypothetical protein G7047_24475 [Diaphorobacter sp. HDW4A]|uniref:DUF11 domain-containing protein n=1 Tax=Diaphorobacter sp. HDW4A TaxID=2714924 RepID=UPI0014081E23|nr:DUF11 domain-containing protein [Diaphorobacter sp. HDW4A]QIL82740.1 hypothetical protein G7047_24475 [Diaphorobacter sp. HDW4A]
MTTKFASLRMRDFAKRSGVAILGGTVGVAPTIANAATGSQSIVSGGFKWFINTNITFLSTSSNFGFSEASATQPMQTENGSSQTLNDAFDGAMGWHVHPTGVIANSDKGLNGYQATGGVTLSPASPVAEQAATVTGNVEVLQGLNVTGQLYFPAGQGVARAILTLQNPSASAITVQVTNDNNLGSDANTKIDTTSSGDNVFQLGQDNWVISHQDIGVGMPITDPTITLAGMKLASSADYVDGDDNPYQYFNVTVPAGGTKRVMTLVRLSRSATVAQAVASTFNDLNSLRQAGYVSDLSEDELRSIVNWNYMGFPDLTPALSGPTSLTVGQATNMTLTVTNGGTGTNTDGTLTVTLPTGVNLTTPPAGCIANGTQGFTCTLGAIAAADASATPPVAAGVQTLNFAVTASTVPVAPASISAVITAVTGESNTANNSTSLSVTGAVVVSNTQPVPGLGTVALAGLSGALALMGTRRRRKDLKDTKGENVHQ